MQNIILLFTRFGNHIVFVFLQVLCFTIIINYNEDQKSTFLNTTSIYSNRLDGKVSNWNRYMKLDQVNDSLAMRNARLMERFINLPASITALDTSKLNFKLIAGKVVSSTYPLRNNHFTLDVGSKHGVKTDMGVIDESGLVGIVKQTSENFSHVISILHSQSRISCTVAPHSFPGSLMWKGTDPSIMILDAIPKYANISIGDSVLTNGYSTLFPPGILIGRIKDFLVDRGTGNYVIEVKLNNDVTNLGVAYVVDNVFAEERKKLESQIDE